MSEIMEFLKARLDEDQSALRLALSADWQVDSMFRTVVNRQGSTETQIVQDPSAQVRDLEHIARHDPARALREVAAKRRIMYEYECEVERGAAGSRPDFQARHGGIVDAYSASLRIIASVYADHPDYQQEWAL
jgi:hypothetical protein